MSKKVIVLLCGFLEKSLTEAQRSQRKGKNEKRGDILSKKVIVLLCGLLGTCFRIFPLIYFS